ncbi:zinc-dependent alcohol dehydrogenase family protein [Clostridium sp. C105KSO13]|uniref:zinc-dependent alcohol dehydrogenase family protein n=1 Tax=Clostridium sp. C105KSO13 TaxID=1776045 RepID=UPI0007405C81|nr:zinc-binding dehydrogenase [Clostridium sp. C105KSO13]CUX37836.1 D-arabitol-phosphate dehydrogenase [Clostridium sp. C105KSO13]
MNQQIPKKMLGMKLPGGAKVESCRCDVPVPGHGQVLLKMKAASLCGSDLKYIYFEHTDKTGGARYDNVIAGHEPSGQVVSVGEGVTDFKEGDKVVVYHIQGCGYCDECKKGFFINCQQPQRRAYGWQRDGALAEYMVADTSTCMHLPDFLTYEDGAMIACGFGTAYQGLLRANVSGRDIVMVMGLGPVGQAAIMLAKAMGAKAIGVDISPERLEMAKRIGADEVVQGGEHAVSEVMNLTDGKGVEAAVDCSGSSIGRHQCLEAARMWGNVVFLGEQGTVTFEPSPLLLHKNLTLHGSWVTSVGNMERLVEFLDRKKIHPSDIITHRFPLKETDKAFELFATGKTGKVCINHEME